MSGSSNNSSSQQPAAQQTVQKAEPWSGVQPYLSDVYGRAKAAADQTPTTVPDGPLRAVENNNMLQANNAKLDLSQYMGGDWGKQSLMNANDVASGKYLQPGSNPTLQPAINAAIAPTLDYAKNFVLPQVSSSAWKSGAFAGTGHANAMQQAIQQSVTRPAAEAASKIAYDDYSKERQYQLQAPMLAAQAQQMALMPSQLVGEAGVVQQGWEQQAIDDAITRYRMNIEAPWNAIKPYAGIIQNGNPGGVSTTDTVTQAAASGRGGLQGALSGALLGGGAAYGAAKLAPESLGFLGGAGGIGTSALLGGLAGGFF
jgi:hypothetical protein